MHDSGISLSDGLAAGALSVAIVSALGAIGAWRVAHQALNYEKKRDKDLITAIIEFEFDHKVSRTGNSQISFLTKKDVYRYWLQVIVVNAGETTESWSRSRLGRPVQSLATSAWASTAGN
jgi:hypothetical protein